MEKFISPSSAISISLAISLIGGASWLTTIYSEGKENAKKINLVAEKQEKTEEILNRIDRRLSRIEGRLGVRVE